MTIIATDGYLREGTQSCFSLLEKPIMAILTYIVKELVFMISIRIIKHFIKLLFTMFMFCQVIVQHSGEI